MVEYHGSRSGFGVHEDFLIPMTAITWGTGTVVLGNLGFCSVNEGSFAQTVDEPGGILAITTDTGDDDNAVLYAGVFQPADGPTFCEGRFKWNSATLGAIYLGFTETLSTATPVMPGEFATTTMTYNGTGGMVGVNWDSDGTTDDFRSVFGDAGVISGTSSTVGRERVLGDAYVADRWVLARAEIDPDGRARVYVGARGVPGSPGSWRLVEERAAVVTPGDNFFAVLMFENRSGAARLFEVDYFEAWGSRDWDDA